MDDEGNIIVADSRNDRIQVVSAELYYVILYLLYRCFHLLVYFYANLVERVLVLVNLTDLVEFA